MQLLFGQVDLGRCALGVEQAGAHADGHLIEIANFAEDFVGGAPESDEPALFCQRPPVPQQNVLLRESAGQCERFLTRTAGKGAAVRKADILPGLIREPEPPDVLNAVKHDATAHIEASAVVVERRDMWLYGLVGHGALLDDWEW